MVKSQYGTIWPRLAMVFVRGRCPIKEVFYLTYTNLA